MSARGSAHDYFRGIHAILNSVEAPEGDSLMPNPGAQGTPAIEVATRPPLSRLVRGLVLVLLCIALNYGIWGRWIHLAWGVPLVAILLWIAGRDFSRMILPARIIADEGGLHLNLPRLPFVLSPCYGIYRESVRWEQVLGTEFVMGDRSELRLVLPDHQVRITSGHFDVSIYTIDQRLRQAQAGFRAGILLPRTPLKEFVSTPRYLTFSLAVLLGGFQAYLIPMINLKEPDRKLRAIPFLPGVAAIGMVILAATPRSRVLLDSDGIFHERGRRTAYIPWDAIPPGVSVRERFILGVTISTLAGRRGNQTVSMWFENWLGLGLSVDSIVQAIRDLRLPGGRISA